ncbi:ROK family protein [Paenibacillus sp. J22TS3]|uniref:ROK family transcriptional regulator n=1 Tax=Paenibacillus sp. J22TS3 TaxID=2807192 RepID=UPI0035B556D3
MNHKQITAPKELRTAIVRGIRSALLELGSATKAELCHYLGISFPTASKFLAQLQKRGELIAVGYDDSSGGRRAKRYAYNADYMLGLAIFMEKTETNYVIFNCLGEIKDEGTTAGALESDAEHLTQQIAGMIAKHPKISSIAIGVPGAVNNGRIIYIPGYEHFRDLNLKLHLESRFAIPVVVENDMNAAVLGYSRAGAAGNSSLVYICFGQNGPGAGLLINGDVVRGKSFFTGEVSFLPQYEHLNFGQALSRHGRDKASGLLTDAQVDAISRLVAAFTAIINPHTIIFSRDEVEVSSLERITNRSADYIPGEHLPKLSLGNLKKDYLDGLQYLGLELMISGAGESPLL